MIRQDVNNITRAMFALSRKDPELATDYLVSAYLGRSNQVRELVRSIVDTHGLSELFGAALKHRKQAA